MGFQIYFWKYWPSLVTVHKMSLNSSKLCAPPPQKKQPLPVVLWAPHLGVSSLSRLPALQPLLVPLTYKALVGSLFMVTCEENICIM